MINKKTCIAIAIMAFLISGGYTMVFMLKAANSFSDKFIAFCIVLLFEPFKAIAFYFIAVRRPASTTIFAMTIITWAILTVSSITASTCYMINMDNKNANEALLQSPEYKVYLEKSDALNVQKKEKQEQLKTAISNGKDILQADTTENANNAKLLNEYNSNIATWQKQLNNKRTELQDAINRTTQKFPMTQTKARINSEIKDLQDRIAQTTNARDQLKSGNKTEDNQKYIDQLNADINKLIDDINGLTVPTLTAYKPTNGFIAFFQRIADGLNEVSQTKFSADALSFAFFFIVMGVTPELIANLSFYYAETLENRSFTKKVSDSMNSIGYRTEPVISKYAGENLRRPIGFQHFDIKCEKPMSSNASSNQAKKEAFTREDIEEFLDHCYNNRTGQKAPGTQSFKNGTDLSYSQIRAIRYHLDKLGILSVDPESKRTEILVDNLDDAMTKI